ncbi:MAG TPA: hypothetical protein VGN54_14890 [Mycobacteriales bacterium]|jgi:hypothetical protein|nr:hypothetical protein [Mycobacteriales bacterium]
MTDAPSGPGRRWQLPAQEEDPDRRGLWRPKRRFVVGLLVILAVLAVGRALTGGGHGPAKLPISCQRATFALRTGTVALGGNVAFAVTGPAGNAYGLYLDVSAVTVGPDGHRQVATRGGVPVTATESLLVVTHLDGCYAEGSAGLTTGVTRGPHTVTLFRLAPDGSTTELLSKPLIVN